MEPSSLILVVVPKRVVADGYDHICHFHDARDNPRRRSRAVVTAARRPRPIARRIAQGLGVPALGSPGLLPLASIRGPSIEPPDVG